MDIQITINVPQETASTGPRAPLPATPSSINGPPPSPETSHDPVGTVAWFPAPPEDVGDVGVFSENGSESGGTSLPSGLEELELEFTADADDIGPPDVFAFSQSAVLGQVIPPGLEELELTLSAMSSESSDVAPPDPSEFESTKKPQRRRKTT